MRRLLPLLRVFLLYPIFQAAPPPPPPPPPRTDVMSCLARSLRSAPARPAPTGRPVMFLARACARSLILCPLRSPLRLFGLGLLSVHEVLLPSSSEAARFLKRCLDLMRSSLCGFLRLEVDPVTKIPSEVAFPSQVMRIGDATATPTTTG